MFAWILLLVVAVCAYVLVASILLPKLYLKMRYTITESLDRGIKSVLEKNGKSIVYEPEIKWRKYVKQYILSERDGVKTLTCKVDETITYLELDVVVFNNQDKVFKVMRVKDLVEQSGYTKTVELPEQTSYIALVVNQVDGKQFEDHLTAKVSRGKMFKFLTACSFVLLMEIMCVKVCLANIFGGVFRESFIFNLNSFIVTLVLIVLAVIINIIVTIMAIKIREEKYVVKEEDNE